MDINDNDNEECWHDWYPHEQYPDEYYRCEHCGSVQT